MRLTIRQVFFVLLVLGLFLMTLRPVTDPDFWWHLRTGQIIVQSHSIPHTDLFSFTNSGKPWIAQEWLSEVILYGLFQLGSYSLLIFFFSLIITGAFLLSYIRSPLETRPFVAGFTLLLGSIATAPTWGVRIQMISLLLTSLFLFLLDHFQKESKLKYIIPMPFIMMVWVNLHAGYFLGLVIIAIYIVVSLIELIKVDHLIIESPRVPDLKPILMLCGALGLSILATLANPNGFHILLYPFQTMTSQAMQQFIQEWFSPDFHQLEWQPLIWFILALIGAGMLGKKEISPTKILLTLIFGYSALRSIRFIPLFAIVAIPILAEQIGSIIKIKSEVKFPSRIFKWTATILIVVTMLVVTLHFSQVVQGEQKSEAAIFPRAAVDWIEAHQPEGNLFNSYGWGGYIIWRLYPQYLVYIDGRADVYGDNFIYTYLDVYRAQPGWEQTLGLNGVRLVLVEPESGLASAMRLSINWEIAYEDQMSVIFSKK
jgi:hypothetical protein